MATLDGGQERIEPAMTALGARAAIRRPAIVSASLPRHGRAPRSRRGRRINGVREA